jgi:alpha,alpha-trehalose-phosphate synthase [UDP-forming]
VVADSAGAPFVVVANRLPVDRSETSDGSVDGASGEWRPSPGGLVTALAPVIRQRQGTWVGWSGAADEVLAPFDAEGLHLVPVSLSAAEVADYYEGFANATLWPLYHDVIAPPQFERRWWDAYVEVNRRFAAAAAAEAGKEATVWVQDYQLQLVPALLRDHRPDLRIGFFNHIPFPGYEIFARLPWRRQVVDGLLGADLLGFQRRQDATNFLRAARRATDATTKGSVVTVPVPEPAHPGDPHPYTGARGAAVRRLRASSFPISIDTAGLADLSRQEATRARSRALRAELGDPSVVLLGVDRLDYTKGLLHRLRAYGELLDEGALEPPDAVFVQVASPSRERVEEYRHLRDELETIVGRVNGDHSTRGRPAVHYLHQSFPTEEMAALYLAADVMLVTPLRDGMNLVAKEYVACRFDERGALVLSEFTGAADELRQAFICNPYDIDGTKEAILAAVGVSPRESARRMRAMRRTVFDADVHHWASAFLDALASSQQTADIAEDAPA